MQKNMIFFLIPMQFNIHYAKQVLAIWLAVNNLPPYQQQYCL